MEFYQALIFLSTLASGVFGNRKTLYAVTGFWTLWTIVMVFAPWLLVIQGAVLVLAFYLGRQIVDNREKNQADKVDIPIKRSVSGRVFMLKTKHPSLGAMDFTRILQEHEVNICKTVKMFPSYKTESLPKALESLDESLQNGDIVAIVRGGGDTSSAPFDTFRSTESIEAIKVLRQRDVLVITGIGHAEDHFPIDDHVDFSAITPTHAAYVVAKWVNGDSLNVHTNEPVS